MVPVVSGSVVEVCRGGRLAKVKKKKRGWIEVGVVVSDRWALEEVGMLRRKSVCRWRGGRMCFNTKAILRRKVKFVVLNNATRGEMGRKGRGKKGEANKELRRIPGGTKYQPGQPGK
ncbi:hypothetical protein IMZ48_45995 [Candidatus Bathyarchaeota archaeon]|nr:hypothetical protein [Candidatus Bathyarchaeota archaeon]